MIDYKNKAQPCLTRLLGYPDPEEFVNVIYKQNNIQ